MRQDIILLIDTRRRDRGRSMVSMAETVVDKSVGKLAVREGRGRLKEIARTQSARGRDERSSLKI